jgi:hypothetical protein
MINLRIEDIASILFYSSLRFYHTLAYGPFWENVTSRRVRDEMDNPHIGDMVVVWMTRSDNPIRQVGLLRFNGELPGLDPDVYYGVGWKPTEHREFHIQGLDNQIYKWRDVQVIKILDREK